jgi:hypothetical protein
MLSFYKIATAYTKLAHDFVPCALAVYKTKTLHWIIAHDCNRSNPGLCGNEVQRVLDDMTPAIVVEIAASAG